MKIGDLAKKANVSVDTLRYYEKIRFVKLVSKELAVDIEATVSKM